ncbi:DUF2358 domain-containing protein [Oculatella sp. LEGE 06141]|uniref:DUF2358 domain-containing protein n=1 Tax=Oculatella sp. LEGE 06141 TaxID=1828648 RepID=UPI0018803DED|nr:DUF2358 domain-containing protein [Oculatella sp. LEGE 06141]MBE9178378.1 DUF2358 domain-containing protein [Oculatella sp. LEGE 06141]
MTDILEILREDYRKFPHDQTYSIYADDVYFKDPLNEFRGRDRYRTMIGFIKTWFINPRMDVHTLERHGNTVKTEWTLHWNTPLPWKPNIAIPGWSELLVNEDGLITSHVDYWRCSRIDVVKQHFSLGK